MLEFFFLNIVPCEHMNKQTNKSNQCYVNIFPPKLKGVKMKEYSRMRKRGIKVKPAPRGFKQTRSEST